MKPLLFSDVYCMIFLITPLRWGW